MGQEKDRLLARKAKIEARLAAIEQSEAKQREKDEKRRAELAGRAVLKRAKKDNAFAGQLRQILNAETAAARDRALFDLPAKTRQPGGQVLRPESTARTGEEAPAAPDPVPALAPSS